MKWFKHQSSASMDDKIERLEDRFGLIGYAAYFKILEACALNWDEVSEPVFTFSLKQIQNKLKMKSKQTDLVLDLFQELNLFEITKTKNEVIIRSDKLAEIKKRYQKKNQIETEEKPSDSTLNKNKEKDIKNKEKETRERSKIIAPDQSFQKTEIVGTTPNFTTIADLFNKTIAGHGKVKHAPFFCPPNALEKFQLISGYKEFQTIDQWRNYFELAKESDFLIGKSKKAFVCTLTWLIEPDNAHKVLSGQYSNASDVDTDELKEQMRLREIEYQKEMENRGAHG